MTVKGTLIPIGGNEDKGKNDSEKHSPEFIEEGILYHVKQQAGGKNATIVVIPTASSIPVEVGEKYLSAFNALGCENVTVLDLRSREDAEKQTAIDLVKAADCIMFSGGDQTKITNKIGGSTIHKIMWERYQDEVGFVIAGTSAGAMAMTDEMIVGGNAVEAFVKGAVTMNKGLGLVKELIIDTHFIKRGRFGRISGAVAKFPNLLGIGLAEDTGLVIKNGKFLVIGSGMVIVFDGSKITHNNEKILDEGTPMTIANLTVHVLSNGDRYYIEERRLSVLPLEADFI